MCDYCDCRSQPAIADLSADHDRLRSLTAELRRTVRGGDRARLPDVTSRLAVVLVPHGEREERGVFAALAAAGVDPAYVERFTRDHDALDALLDAASHGDTDAALALADLLDGHLLREESDLFPAARQLLSPADWDLVAAAHHPTLATEGART